MLRLPLLVGVAAASLTLAACGAFRDAAGETDGGESAHDAATPADRFGSGAKTSGGSSGGGPSGGGSSSGGSSSGGSDSGCPTSCPALGWTTAESNTNMDLYGVWGSARDAIWAVGNNGTAMFFDGTTWKSRSSATTSPLVGVHGTGASNVFALALNNGYDVMRFDGKTWRKRASITGYGVSPAAVYALGDDDAFVYVTYGSYDQPGDLWRVTGGVATKLGASTTNQGTSGCGVWAFSPADVWITGLAVHRWNGATFARAGTTAPAATVLWALSPDFVVAGGGSSPSIYDATHTWTQTSTGLTGPTTGFAGTAPTRVFASIFYGGSNGLAGVGRVARWDGLGWTPEAIPAGTAGLTAIWGAASGEVIAVGQGGTIVAGP